MTVGDRVVLVIAVNNNSTLPASELHGLSSSPAAITTGAGFNNVMSSKNQNYIVQYNGEPVTRLKFQSDGKADLSTGDIMDGIWYTAEEAQEVALSIGNGAEAVRQ